MRTDKIAIAGLFIGLSLLAWYIFKISKKALSSDSQGVPGAISVKDKIAGGYAESMQTLTNGEIDNYGRNLDLLMSEIKVSNSLKVSVPSSSMISGAQALLSLTEANFRAVISAWENRTKLKATDLFKSMYVVDQTQTLPELLYRLKNGSKWA